MVNYVCISILWVSLTVCFGQSAEDQVKEFFQGVSPECQNALVTCAVPVLLPYVNQSPSEAFETARNIQLEQHCRRTRKSFVCLRGLIGKNQCAGFDLLTMVWNKVAAPLIDDGWNYICRTEFKKFHIHYRCLLTAELIEKGQQSCSSIREESEMIDCIVRIIREECGSTASEITKGLFLVLDERFKANIKELGLSKVGEYDDGLQPQSTLPEKVYATNLAILKELLKRK